jgi:hypothetical protein
MNQVIELVKLGTSLAVKVIDNLQNLRTHHRRKALIGCET